MCWQWPAGGGLPQRVCPDGAVRPGAGGRVSPGDAEEKPVSRGHSRGQRLSPHWEGSFFSFPFFSLKVKWRHSFPAMSPELLTYLSLMCNRRAKKQQ